MPSAAAQRPSETPVAALAAGRIALGTAGLLAPGRLVGLFGMPPRADLIYLTRIFGARAIALGSSWLALRGRSRRVVQRLALAVDVSDTIAGAGHLRRADLPRTGNVLLFALTGVYALVGAAHAARDGGLGAAGS